VKSTTNQKNKEEDIEGVTVRILNSFCLLLFLSLHHGEPVMPLFLTCHIIAMVEELEGSNERSVTWRVGVRSNADYLSLTLRAL